MKLTRKEIIFYVLLIAITTVIKVICAPNISLSGTTGILAVGLFAGLNKKYSWQNAFLLPLITLLASNALLQVLYAFNMFPFEGFYKRQLVEYSLIIVITAMGLLFRKANTTGLFISAILGPTVFFLVSNYITWYTMWQQIGYTHDTGGLLNCYTAGLPFFRNSVISTVVLLPSFVMAYHWIVDGKARLSIAE